VEIVVEKRGKMLKMAKNIKKTKIASFLNHFLLEILSIRSKKCFIC